MLDPELGEAELKDAFNQALKVVPHIAKLSREYFLKFKAEGFTDKEALTLTSDTIGRIFKP